MKNTPMSLALILVLGASTACEGPREDRAEDQVDRVEREAEQAGDAVQRGAERAGNAVQETADEFGNDAREALEELREEFDELETSNADLQGESAAAWTRARDEVVQVRQELEADLEQLENASAEEADGIRARIAQNFEAMTHRVERAELLAIDGNEEFLTEARERLAEIDRNIQALQADAARLPVEAREDASRTVESLRSEANDVRETMSSFTAAAPQQIAEQREEVAEDVAALSASVRREALELQADLDN